MYRLIPTEEDARDEDRTVSGSVDDQNGFACDNLSTPKAPFQSIVDKFKSLKPSFLRSSSTTSWRTGATARGTGPTIDGFTLPKKEDEYILDRLFAKRLWRIVKVLLTRECKVPLLYITMTLFCCVNETIVYFVGTIPSKYYKVLGDKDSSAFFRLLISSLITVFLAGFGKSIIFLLGSLLSLETRRTLTLYFHKIYIQPKLFYRILFMHEEEVDNPDQRITQDIDKMAESIKKMVEDLIIIPLLIAFYTWQCWQMTGYVGPLCIYGYFILSAIISRLLINPIVDAVFYKESAEGYFRYLHVRFRQYAESITFSRGEGEAKESADQLLDVLLKTQLTVIHKELPLTFLQQSVSYFGSILSYVIISIPIFMGVYDGLPPSDISAVISKVSFVSMYLTYQFSKIIQSGTDFSDLAGYTSRLGQLMEALDDLNTEMENIAIDFPHEETLSSDTSIRLENVTFNTPAGDLIPYLTYGTLREQLVYPNKDTAASVSNADVIRVLKLARLDHIVEVIEDFDFTYTLDWNKMLSPGEQQKMAFARLFYARPTFAVLDEATSSMDNASENAMFKQCQLLNITCITVCHHTSLERYHQQKLTLSGRGIWSWSEIQERNDGDDEPNDEDDGGSIASSASGAGIVLRLPEDAEFDTLPRTDY
ncbi:ATP-binding cassette sub- D member 4 [Dissophora ornata]|nr:ATP-binding cassette sub- D member 4 [Dissophora ornata]